MLTCETVYIRSEATYQRPACKKSNIQASASGRGASCNIKNCVTEVGKEFEGLLYSVDPDVPVTTQSRWF